jgi:hypothetical protein
MTCPVAGLPWVADAAVASNSLDTIAMMPVLLVLTGATGIGGVPPVLLPDVSMLSVLAFGAFNPVTVAVAAYMGYHADQPAKLLVAAFAAALAGAIFLWFGTLLRLSFLATPGRAAAGIFAAGFACALGWSAIGYIARRRQRSL